MRKRLLFHIKFTASRKGYKPFVISGCVLAEDREQAVKLAKENIQGAVEEFELYNVKLLSATTLKTDFFLMSDLTENTEEK